MRAASRELPQAKYLCERDAKRALCLEMIMQDFGGDQFQVLAMRYRPFDSVVEFHAILLEPGDDVDAELGAFGAVPGTVMAWMTYRDWPEYADQVR